PAERRLLVGPRQVGHRLADEIIFRAAGLVGARVARVRGYSHHGEPLALGSALYVFAEWVLAGEHKSRRGFAEHYRISFGAAVRLHEWAAASHGDPHGGKVTRRDIAP